MNKVYSLKYCYITNTIKVVSELARRVCKGNRGRRIILSLFLTSPLIYFPLTSLASVVKGSIPYQTYRDFSENKGLFKPGATDIPIYNRNGENVGILSNTPMPDLSSVDSVLGVATLVTPQYIASVAHNRGYTGVSFGDGNNKYSIISRNEHGSIDFHLPRLNKLVTEVAPAEIHDTSQKDIMDKSKFTSFYRTGSGSQFVMDSAGQSSRITGAYEYLTGGELPAAFFGHGGTTGIQVYTGGNIERYNVLPSFGRGGDSGSSLFGWNAAAKRWEIVGVFSAIGGGTNLIYKLMPYEFIKKTIAEYTDKTVTFNSKLGQDISWTFDSASGLGELKQGNEKYVMHGKQENNLNAGKDLVFTGKDGKVNILNNISQGGGALTFIDDYSVTTSNNSTWTGAGIIVNKGATVNWQINGVAKDNLHKLGEGTLLVNATGVNKGGLKAGDGTTILAQKPDDNSNVQAFSSVNISSGRPTVILSDEKQVNPDNITWGYRGGTLELSGNNLTFHKLNAADYGAVITSNTEENATLTLDLGTNSSDIPLKTWSDTKQGRVGDLYKYNNPYTKTLDYFILKKENYGYFPVWQTSNDSWEYIGHNQNDAQRIAAERFNSVPYIYHGQLTGNLNVRNIFPEGLNRAFIMDGSANMSGAFEQENGRLVLQGHPVIHAYNTKAVADKLSSLGDNSVLTQPTSLNQNDWEDRIFRFGKLILRNVDFGLSRSAHLFSDIHAENSHMTLGDQRAFIDRLDGKGVDFFLVEGNLPVSSESLDSSFSGNVYLNKNSVLTINSKFDGELTSSDSIIIVNGKDVILRRATLSDSQFVLNSDTHVINGLKSDNKIEINNASLYLDGNLIKNSVFHTSKNWLLSGDNSKLFVNNGTSLFGDILSSYQSTVSFGYTDSDQNCCSENPAFYSGIIDMPNGRLNMSGAKWSLAGSSFVQGASINNSSITYHSNKLTKSPWSLAGVSPSQVIFSEMKMKTLELNNSNIIFRTDGQKADKIVVEDNLKGSNNTLYVNFLKKKCAQEKLAIPLIDAPLNSGKDIFNTGVIKKGFSSVSPVIESVDRDGRKQWLLTGYRAVENKAVTKPATGYMRTGSNNFIVETNNMNKRMGELRELNASAGAWARIVSGEGSSDNGYHDNYSHLQIGFDKENVFEDRRVFTGITSSYTNTNVNSLFYGGKTKTYGGGFYTTTLYDSGWYSDFIMKALRSEREYNLSILNAGKQKSFNNSAVAEMEVGYRYYLSQKTFIEPQVNIIGGYMGGNNFSWAGDDNSEINMSVAPSKTITGKTGLVLGRNISSGKLSLTTRVGLHYESDLISRGNIQLKDDTETYNIKNGKDKRLHYTFGINGGIGDKTRFGLELEKTNKGRYNIDNLINANVRYSF